MSFIRQLIIAAVIIGAIAIVLVFAKYVGIVIPAIVWTIGWIVLCVVLVVVALKFLANLLKNTP